MSSSVVVRQDFGPEGAAYLRQQLGMSSKALGTQFARRDIERGSTFAFVPSAAPAADRARFEFGLFTVYGGSQRDAMSEWIADKLKSVGERALVCFEDPFAEPTDPFIEQSSRRLFFSGDGVYPYLEGTPAKADVKELLHWVTHYPAIGFLGRVDETIEARAQIDSGQLAALTEGAAALIIGAYDAEGFVVCELGELE